MSFATPLFLWLFLPAVLATLLVVGRRPKNVVIALASIGFYSVGGGALTLLLLSSILVNFVAGLLIEPAPYRSEPARRRVLVIAVVANLASLAIWKYADFASGQLRSVLDGVGLDSPVLHLVLPIGISFYTFHQISYLVDVYRGAVPAQTSVTTFITYVAMFPQLIAGPIVRYKEIADQLDSPRRVSVDTIVAGFPRFAWGLTKKVVIADSIAPIAAAVFDTPQDDLTATSAWIGLLAYSVQLYFDFSGYTDMALGLGLMLGFRLPENFDRPYSAISVTDFWRRWHMSLSRWFRDYVYIPLGGNRRGAAITYRNLWIVFLLTGIWHGAGWTFLAWGAYHGGLLAVERALGIGSPRRGSRPGLIAVRRCATAVMVTLGWVLFRSADLPRAGAMLQALAGRSGWGITAALDAAMTPQRVILLVAASVVFLLPRRFVFGRFLADAVGPAANNARLAVMTVGLGYSAVLVIAGTFSPFLYFQF